MANFYPVTSLIGGATGALDHIDGSSLADGDRAIVITTTNTYAYRLNATSGATELSPGVISPDTNAGDKRWILVSVGGVDVGVGVSYQSGDKPAAGAIVSINPPFPIAFPAGLSTSTYKCPTATKPTSVAAVSVQKNGVEFGTLTVQVDNTYTFASAAGGSINGTTDWIDFVFPTPQDATWAGMSLTLKGERS